MKHIITLGLATLIIHKYTYSDYSMALFQRQTCFIKAIFSIIDKEIRAICCPPPLFLFLLLFLPLMGCDDNNLINEEPKIIEKFVFTTSLNEGLGTNVTATIVDTVISAVMPPGTDLTALAPTVTIDKSLTLTPESGEPQDFTAPVQYTVAARDKTTREYSVRVTLTKHDQADIIKFSATADNQPIEGIVQDETILLPSQFDDQVIEMTITEMQLSLNATASKQVGDVLVFQDGVAAITVTAEDGMASKQYLLFPIDIATEIQSFKIEKKNNKNAYTSLHDSDTIIHGIIDRQTKEIYIDVTPYIYALDRTALVATFEVGAESKVHVGGVQQVSGSTPNDFTSTLIYEVTSSNAAKSGQYTVILAETDKAIIPDGQFRASLQRQVADAFDEEGKMDVTHTAVQKLEIIDVGSKGVSSLKGVEFFTALEKLYCQRNRLTHLNIEKNTKLKILNCSNNQLTFLEASKNNDLVELWCHSNQLDTLGISNNNALTVLSCFGNKLTDLTINAPTVMKVLSCRDNLLANLEMPRVKSVRQLIINAGEKEEGDGDEDEDEIRKNPLITLSINESMKNHAEIKEAKTTRVKQLTIAVYDDNGNLTCPDYDPNTESCN